MVEVTISDDFYSEVQQALAEHQPELTISRTDNLIVLDGRFVVSGPAGPFDSYQIKARIRAGFPAEEPVVFEEGGRIPRIVDRHIFPEHGNCCLGVWEEWLLTGQDHRFETFLTGPMHDYFVSQTYYEVHGGWPFGERSHGRLGIIEAYGDLLCIPPNEKTIIDYLYLLSRQTIRRTHITAVHASPLAIRRRKGRSSEVDVRRPDRPGRADRRPGEVPVRGGRSRTPDENAVRAVFERYSRGH